MNSLTYKRPVKTSGLGACTGMLRAGRLVGARGATVPPTTSQVRCVSAAVHKSFFVCLSPGKYSLNLY
jgi:hypothetical protein